MRLHFALLLASALAFTAHAKRTTTTTRTTRVVEVAAPSFADEKPLVLRHTPRRTSRRRPITVSRSDDGDFDDEDDSGFDDGNEDYDDDDDRLPSAAPSGEFDTHLRAGTYEIYRNPLQFKKRDQLRDLSGRVIYSLKRNGVFSRGFTLFDKLTDRVLWRARSGGLRSWSSFTSPYTSEEIRVKRRRMHWHYKFRFTYHGRVYTWEQEPSFKYRMSLYRVIPKSSNRIKLLELRRTWTQVHRRAIVKISPHLIAAIRRDPSLEGLVVAMALRLNEEIKKTQIVKTVGAVGAANILTN